MIELRPYQQEAIDSVLKFWREGGGNPLIEMATGLGKSVVIAKLTQDLLRSYPDMRVLMLVHVKELVEQNAMALLRLWPGAPIGIYSAGLGRKDTHRHIIFGSIQSLYRQDGFSIGHRDLILIDEAHLVPAKGDGMYLKLLEALRVSRPDLRVCGFTATPYRLDSGRLDRGDDRLFDEIVYKYGVGDGIKDGWLSPLISKASLTTIDVSGVAKRGGEFIAGALEAAVDKADLTEAAVGEMISLAADRKSWLVFCAGVDHAHHVRDAIRRRGVSCETIVGETDSRERAHFISQFKAGRIRCLTNANVLTTGFDAPGVDLIAMLRPTLSTGLYVQMCGRGTRLATGKDNCLVLDFAGNVLRHGPVDIAKVKEPGEGSGEAPVKECPSCHSYVLIALRTCPDCGHEFPPPEEDKHERQAINAPILSTEKAFQQPDEHPVVNWEPRYHTSMSSDVSSVRVVYRAGLQIFSEWWCFEHEGFARRKAEKLWRDHGGQQPYPNTVHQAMARWAELTPPASILTRRNDRHTEIVGRRFTRRAA